MNLWIKNGHVLDPANHLDEVCDVYVKEGKVACVGSLSSDKIPDECTVIDAEGKYVMPGLVDLHVHLREPGFEYKETIYSGTHAMAKGGFTAVCPMPNTKPVTDSPAMIEKILKIAKTDSPIRVYPVGAVTKGQLGEEMTDIAGMVKAGAKAISEDGKSVMNAEIYREAMKEAKKAGIPVLAHCEDKNMVGHGACGRRCDCGKRYSSCERNRSSSSFVSLFNKRQCKNGSYCKKGWRQCISRSMSTSFCNDRG